ncbi:hypothetical protein K3495_g9275 [Podosphaera aphanis]|nr:hypothetical protein K3495_g9275 [Podosphaera aphanis]
MQKHSLNVSYNRNRPRRNFGLRAFAITIICISSLVLWSIAAEKISSFRHRNQLEALQRKALEQLADTSFVKPDEECRLVHNAKDKCAFVKANCKDEEAGLLSYLTFYYCILPSVPIIAFITLTLWLALLFTTIGIAASDFFCINLNTISSILGMSEALAGTTFLAFGNGSPDVFSTFAAMKSNSGSLAVGELIGAASFITAVVAGSMALAREFKVEKKTFVRDVGFFILAVNFTTIFLADGFLHLWECCVMVGLYILYVIIVVLWHWYLGVRHKKQERETVARGQYLVTPNEELVALQTDTYDEDIPVGRRSRAETEDLNLLEQRPVSRCHHYDDDSDEEIQNGIRLAAEMANSMRITRPKCSRRNTITPIRPSLIGALEFRSALSVVEKSRQSNNHPIHLRQYSEDGIGVERYTDEDLDVTNVNPSNTASSIKKAASTANDAVDTAKKKPASVINNDISINEMTTSDSYFSKDTPLLAETRVGRSMTLSLPTSPSNHRRDTISSHSSDRRRRGITKTQAFSSDYIPKMTSQGTQNLRLQIPSPTDHPHTSLTPFPQIPIYVDSPDGVTSQDIKASASASSPVLSHANRTSENGFPENGFPELASSTCHENFATWWPHRCLPAPNILFQALFPTLSTWRDKSAWEKFIGVVSAPTIFLLAITLPVVELESQENDQIENELLESLIGSNLSSRRPSRRGWGPLLTPDRHSFDAEPDWLTCRQATCSHSCSSRRQSQRSHQQRSAIASAEELRHDPFPTVFCPDRSTLGGEQGEQTGLESVPLGDWNRWLVSVQIFAAPLFMVIIFWANKDEKSTRLLAEMIFYSLLASLVVYSALVVTTSPTEIPKYRFLLCFLGFIVSICWISTIANEVVGVLKTLGIILGISDAILGLTIFAVGNSLGDLVADITVARLGFPVMALSACFGGPILNILLGIGLSGTYITVSQAKKKHAKYPMSHIVYEPYKIEISDTLVISAVTLVITLVGLLIAVPLNKWIMSRRIGWGLIIIWSISILLNLGVEIDGIWGSGNTAMRFQNWIVESGG